MIHLSNGLELVITTGTHVQPNKETNGYIEKYLQILTDIDIYRYSMSLGHLIMPESNEVLQNKVD